MPNNNRNRVEIPEARKALDKMKTEIATELGITDYAHIDKGSLSSRENGKVGGNMVRRMIKYAEEQMAKNS
jgi:DNA-binding XRE family transcriptional regulator